MVSKKQEMSEEGDQFSLLLRLDRIKFNKWVEVHVS